MVSLTSNQQPCQVLFSQVSCHLRLSRQTAKHSFVTGSYTSGQMQEATFKRDLLSSDAFSLQIDIVESVVKVYYKEGRCTRGTLCSSELSAVSD